MAKNYFVHPTAVIDPGAQIGEGTKIWHFTHISGKAKVGKNCTLGQGVFIDNEVEVGDFVKIQNNTTLCRGVKIESEVFLGPGICFTNDKYPKVKGEWQVQKTLIKKGASIGANVTFLPGIVIGEKAMVGAGAVVTKSIPREEVWVGNPARKLK